MIDKNLFSIHESFCLQAPRREFHTIERALKFNASSASAQEVLMLRMVVADYWALCSHQCIA
jgi:hypothetical protein